MIDLFEMLDKSLSCLSRCHLINETSFSQSQFYSWFKSIKERKEREPKLMSEEAVCSGVEVILKYPHFSGLKGQAYMIYHQLGYISQHFYKMLKKIVQRIVFQEVSRRDLLPKRTSYQHERPSSPGEIWAEDFTVIKVNGVKFYVSLLIDVFSNYYLGAEVSRRANVAMVESPVKQALEINGRGPERFLLSDNGSQYISDAHGQLLDKLDIIQKRIPACTPEYNGSCECSVKEFKNVFYNVWSKRNTGNMERNSPLLCQIKAAVVDTVTRMNNEIPRPSLRGVTPNDIQEGVANEKINLNQKYLEQEQTRKEVQPWTRNKWQLVKDVLFENGLSDLELMTKFCFFLKRPLRKLVNLSPELSGN